MFEIDHIDPQWKEGRDYQLVCGREVPENYYRRDSSLNSQKSNRFLPWRVCPNELGGVPVEVGDLCQFLNIETGEWVLEEFMGDWWFEKTRKLCGESFGGKKGGRTQGRRAAESGQLALAREKVHKPTQLAEARSHRDTQEHSDWGKTLASKTNSVRWRCLDTGHVSTAGPLTIYQTRRGIDPSLREKLG
jgi:hypothetical protein